MLRFSIDRGFVAKRSVCQSRLASSWSSSKVREAFLDHFAQEDHCIVPSSSVVPKRWKNIQSLPFVNAGMVRWRPIFMNEIDVPKRFEKGVANSQKCIRVGGKHCDLNQVGQDGHHLSYFEMLGSWAFNNAYNREKSIKSAWDLMTNTYGLPKDRLFVTYFNGCEKLGLPPDKETKEVWLSIGVDPERIVPFGSSDNFWQMGLDGPCGPCTEIHYSHVDGKEARSLVNSSSDQTVVELWNLVFMEHYMNDSGQLSSLENKHVDTGMGLERLTAILGGSKSNYDTDLFHPLFETISRVTKTKPYSGSFSSDFDRAQRILADHMRMITVCLSDGIIPGASSKLRQVLRRAYRIQSEHFGLSDFESRSRMMYELSEAVLQTLSFHYPNPAEQLSFISSVLRYEAEAILDTEKEHNDALKKLTKMRGTSILDIVDPGNAKQCLGVFMMLERNPEEIVNGVVSGDFAYKITDSTGVAGELLHQCLEAYGVTYDPQAYARKREEVKKSSKQASMISQHVEVKDLEPTDDSSKYDYSAVGTKAEVKYTFPILQAKVMKVVENNGQVAVLLNKTCCYGEAGGQKGDSGRITNVEGQKLMMIDDTQVSPDGKYIWHIGELEDGRNVEQGQRVKVNFKIPKRIALMQNHTATHLLNSVLHQVMPGTTQASSYVHEEGFKFDVFSLQNTIDANFVLDIEQKVSECIGSAAPVERITAINPEATLETDESLADVLSQDFPTKKIITMPEESYPSEVSLICLPDSIEPCCGTHVTNLADIQDFVITSVKKPQPGLKSFRCLTGAKAIKSREAGTDLIDSVISICQELDQNEDCDYKAISKKLKKLQNQVKDVKGLLPYAVKEELRTLLGEIVHHVESGGKVISSSTGEDIWNSEEDIVVGQLDTHVSTKSINKKLKAKPYFVLSCVDKDENAYIAVCNVPKDMNNLDPEKWMKHVLGDVKVKTRNKFVGTEQFNHDDPEKLVEEALLYAQKHIQ